MSSISDISVTVEQSPTEQVVAVLNEIDTLLQQLITSGQEGSIDLRSLPLFPGDYDMLKQLLAEGEVSATLQAMGPSKIQETRVPGVWWVTHHNEDDEKIAEYIEVTRLPSLLKTTEEDLLDGPTGIKLLIEQFLNNQND